MDLIKTIDALIESAKEGGKTFKSMSASENLINSIDSNAKLRTDSLAAQKGITQAQLEFTIMMLLDEINRQEREIKSSNKCIEIYKETINSIG